MTHYKTRYLWIATLFVSSCAFFPADVLQHPYDNATPSINVSTNESIAVGVHDQRPYIVSNEKEEKFVGLQRAGFGHPFDVTTTSGAPLAQDFAKVIVSSLNQKGVKAVAVRIAPHWSTKEALQALTAMRQKKTLLITLKEWKSDTYGDTVLLYDIRLEVFGDRGDTLAQKSLHGTDELRGRAKDALPIAYTNKLEELLNAEKILESLN